MGRVWLVVMLTQSFQRMTFKLTVKMSNCWSWGIRGVTANGLATGLISHHFGRHNWNKSLIGRMRTMEFSLFLSWITSNTTVTLRSLLSPTRRSTTTQKRSTISQMIRWLSFHLQSTNKLTCPKKSSPSVVFSRETDWRATGTVSWSIRGSSQVSSVLCLWLRKASGLVRLTVATKVSTSACSWRKDSCFQGPILSRLIPHGTSQLTSTKITRKWWLIFTVPSPIYNSTPCLNSMESRFWPRL